MGFAAGEVAWNPAARAATADDHPQPAIAERGDDVAADEAGATEDEHDRCGATCGRLGIGGGLDSESLDCESAHALLLFDGSVGYFCLDRNI